MKSTARHRRLNISDRTALVAALALAISTFAGFSQHAANGDQTGVVTDSAVRQQADLQAPEGDEDSGAGRSLRLFLFRHG